MHWVKPADIEDIIGHKFKKSSNLIEALGLPPQRCNMPSAPPLRKFSIYGKGRFDAFFDEWIQKKNPEMERSRMIKLRLDLTSDFAIEGHMKVLGWDVLAAFSHHNCSDVHKLYQNEQQLFYSIVGVICFDSGEESGRRFFIEKIAPILETDDTRTTQRSSFQPSSCLLDQTKFKLDDPPRVLREASRVIKAQPVLSILKAGPEHHLFYLALIDDEKSTTLMGIGLSQDLEEARQRAILSAIHFIDRIDGARRAHRRRNP